MHSQLVVIGGGPGGYAAAFLAADLGQQVTLVESAPRLGGACLLRGCIPSKLLLHVARLMCEVHELAGSWGLSYGPPQLSLETLRSRKDQVIATLSGGLSQLAKRRGVRVVAATASFQSSDSIVCRDDQGAPVVDGEITFEHCIIATGSSPVRPASLGAGSLGTESPLVLDSTAALKLNDVPPRLLVIGGGYIGLELGTVFAALGSEVSLVEMTDRLLPGADRDLVKPLQQRLTNLFGGRIQLNTKVDGLADVGGAVDASLAGPEGTSTHRFDRVLVAVGRRPHTDGLALHHTQATLNATGFIECDATQRTSDPRIFAVGDVAGEPMLAHKATRQARVAVETILGRTVAFDPSAIPAVVFTDPEIAWVGLTAEAAQQAGRAIRVASYPWAASGRAHAIGRPAGLTKWIVDPQDERVLGCGIVGAGAGELVAAATLAIQAGCSIRSIADVVAPHPTLSETLTNAADAYLGIATEIYKPRR